MPKKCCVSNCKVQQDDPEGLRLSFYKIPADENVKKQWLESIRQHCDIDLKKYSFVCSRHFEKECFDTSCSGFKNGKLKKGCCPTIFVNFKNLKLQNTANKKDVIVNEFIKIENEETSSVESELFTQKISPSSNTLMLHSLTHQEVCNTPMQTEEMPSAYECTMQETTIPPVESTNTFIFKESIENMHPSTMHCNNIEEINENRSKAMCNIPRNIYKLSLGNINLSKLDFSPVNLPGLKRLLYKGQNEIRVLQRKMKSKRMKIYRHNQRVTCVKSLVSHIKQHEYISDKLSDILEAKTIIANVYDFLQAEYENLKCYTGDSCDFSPLANIVKRTAAATKVSEATVKEILEERSSEEYTRETVSRKRARVTPDFEDEDVSPIEEDSSGESADDAQHGDGESTIDIEEHPIETLKVEIEENEEYHSEANHGMLFQIQPLSTQQLSAIHQSLPPTAPTHTEVKQEPADVEDHERLDAGDAVKDTASFDVPICESTSAVHHLLRSNLQATLEPTKNVDQDMEYSSTSTTQVGRQPD